MDIKTVRKFAELMNAEGLGLIEISDAEFSVRIARDPNAVPAVTLPKPTRVKEAKPAPTLDQVKPAPDQSPPKPTKQKPAPETQIDIKSSEAAAPLTVEPLVVEPIPSPAKTKKGKATFEVRSPLTGIFYEARADGESPYVELEDYVERGDVLCLIEANDQLNEITSDTEGKVVAILVKDNEPVTLDQIMFKIISDNS